MFINRDEELNSLEERHNSGKAEFMVIYGRRRVGKTELIDRFIENKNGIRLLARIESEKNNLDRFSSDLAAFFKDEVLRANPFQNWDAFLSYLAERSKDKRIVIAIDEFPYLIDSNKSLPSALQDYWDRKLRNSNIFLILCGSSIAMMVDKVLGHKSPLYGRRTGQIKLEPMDFFNACRFYKTFKAEDLVYAYSILGGAPGYLLEFDDKKTMAENIKEKFLKKDKFLFQDAEFVLKEELKEPKFYFSILRAIAIGKTRIGDIMNEAGLDKGIVGKYLSVLIELGIINREVSVMEKHPHKSRKGIYILRDNFYKFWFRFIFPNIEEIERKRQDFVISSKIMPELNRYTSYIFEDICREWLWKQNLFNYGKIGRWWDKGKEIDIIAFNEERILFAECKWQNSIDAEKIIMELRDKAAAVERSSDLKESYAVFAKSFKNKFKEENVYLFDLKDMEKSL